MQRLKLAERNPRQGDYVDGGMTRGVLGAGPLTPEACNVFLGGKLFGGDTAFDVKSPDDSRRLGKFSLV